MFTLKQGRGGGIYFFNETSAGEVEVGFRYILYIDILKNYFSYNIIYLALSQSEFPMNNSINVNLIYIYSFKY